MHKISSKNDLILNFVVCFFYIEISDAIEFQLVSVGFSLSSEETQRNMNSVRTNAVEMYTLSASIAKFTAGN